MTGMSEHLSVAIDSIVSPEFTQTRLPAIGQAGANRLHSRMYTMPKDIWRAKISLTIYDSKLGYEGSREKFRPSD
jgi:hypothetical protein